MTRVRVLRHYRENLRKCSLEPLRGDPRFELVTWRPGRRYDAGGCVLLELDARPLAAEDAGCPLLVLDSTWRYLPALRESLDGAFESRALPPAIGTVYPRVAKLGPNPPAGLASIEAVYAALRILGERDDRLLDHYRWKARFLGVCERAGIDPKAP